MRTGVDRIADPWGVGTPYRRPPLAERLAAHVPDTLRSRLPGDLRTRSPWPVRVDTYLLPGLTEDDVDRWVQSASLLHSNGDALDIAVKDGRMVGVRGLAIYGDGTGGVADSHVLDAGTELGGGFPGQRHRDHGPRR